MTQKDLSHLTGISLRTIQRLELGEVSSPPLRYLVNIAIVLDVELDEILDEEWLTWHVFDQSAPRPVNQTLKGRGRGRLSRG